MKLNCWEVMNCTRECPAKTESAANEMNSGKNGGRVCFAIPGTCRVEPGAKMSRCMRCDFYRMVRFQEGSEFLMASTILAQLAGEKHDS